MNQWFSKHDTLMNISRSYTTNVSGNKGGIGAIKRAEYSGFLFHYFLELCITPV